MWPTEFFFFFVLCPPRKFFSMSEQRVKSSHTVASEILLLYSVQCKLLVNQSSSHLPPSLSTCVPLSSWKKWTVVEWEAVKLVHLEPWCLLGSCHLWVLLGPGSDILSPVMPWLVRDYTFIKAFPTSKTNFGKVFKFGFQSDRKI